MASRSPTCRENVTRDSRPEGYYSEMLPRWDVFVCAQSRSNIPQHTLLIAPASPRPPSSLSTTTQRTPSSHSSPLRIGLSNSWLHDDALRGPSAACQDCS